MEYIEMTGMNLYLEYGETRVHFEGSADFAAKLIQWFAEQVNGSTDDNKSCSGFSEIRKPVRYLEFANSEFVFAIDHKGCVAEIKITTSNCEDKFELIALYGLYLFEGKRCVTSRELSEIACNSGKKAERVDYNLSAWKGFYETHGEGHEKRYGLTSKGLGYCESLLRV